MQHRLLGQVTGSGRFELCVAFDEFLGAATRETDGDAAVFIVAFNADDGANAVGGVTHFASEHWIGIGTAL